MNLKLHLPGDFALRTRWVPLSRRNPGDRTDPVGQPLTTEGQERCFRKGNYAPVRWTVA